MQPFVFRKDTLKVSWESLKLHKVSKKLETPQRVPRFHLKLSKKLETPQRVPRFHSKLETPSCSKGRGECIRQLCNFDINVSPPHFNLTSALEVEDKYKTEVEEKLR